MKFDTLLQFRLDGKMRGAGVPQSVLAGIKRLAEVERRSLADMVRRILADDLGVGVDDAAIVKAIDQRREAGAESFSRVVREAMIARLEG